MKLAHLILVHRFPEQAVKLIHTLVSDPEVHAFIHVDAKSNGVYEIIQAEFKNEARVIFTPKRYKVYWGSYNQIRATLLLMRTAAEYGKFGYYSLISGQDLPIKPIAQFKEYLRKNNGKEFMVHFKLPNPGNWGGNGGLDRLQLFWLDTKIQRYSFTFGRINRFIHKLQNTIGYKRGLKFEVYGGFNWFTLSDNAVRYILDFVKGNKNYLKRFRYTSCADEIFVQTILMNSLFKNNMINTDLRHINWSTGPEHPKIMRMEDYEVLTKEDNKFMARKFDPATDTVIIDKILDFVNQR